MISFFVDNFSASIFMKIYVSRLHPPYADITNGVKEPCSISITRWLYFRFFSFSLLINELVRDWLRCVEANGLKILTSKNACSPLIQKLLAHMSKRASSSIFALQRFNRSPVNGINGGSNAMSLHTCCSISAKTFRICINSYITKEEAAKYSIFFLTW